MEIHNHGVNPEWCVICHQPQISGVLSTNNICLFICKTNTFRLEQIGTSFFIERQFIYSKSEFIEMCCKGLNWQYFKDDRNSVALKFPSTLTNVFYFILLDCWWLCSCVSWGMMTSSNGYIFCVTDPSCENSPVNGEFPSQRPLTRSFDVFFDLRLDKGLSKQSWGWWFEKP